MGLIAPFIATAFGTFLLRQFFMSIPKDLYDAAKIDGCSDFRFLVEILTPLARPALGTLAVYSFLQIYNQYLWPLLITNSTNMRTVQIGITMLKEFEREQWQIVLAGVVTIMIPTLVLFFIANRQLIRGLTAGAIKG
jgi:sn-glycerol 3-phosphate transport system permease protein